MKDLEILKLSTTMAQSSNQNEESKAVSILVNVKHIILRTKESHEVVYKIIGEDGIESEVYLSLKKVNVPALLNHSDVSSDSHHFNVKSALCSSSIANEIQPQTHVGPISSIEFLERKDASLLNDSWNDILSTMKEDKRLLSTNQKYLNVGLSSHTSCKELSYPHVPYSLEELSLVKTLTSWSNRNVRVIGKAAASDEGDENMWYLESVGEDGGPFRIGVLIHLLEKQPPEGRVLQIFGELRLDTDNTSPFILAKFFTGFDSVDLFYYRKSIDVMRHKIPHFVGCHEMKK